jgi:uncharacterized protein (DUF2267 family)
MLIRGFYFEGWDPNTHALKERHLEPFLARIEQELEGDAEFQQELEPEQVARAVFEVMQRRVTEGEIEDVRNMLPSRIRVLWPVPESATTTPMRG